MKKKINKKSPKKTLNILKNEQENCIRDEGNIMKKYKLKKD